MSPKREAALLLFVPAAFAMTGAALAADSLDIAIGKNLFERNWVSAPSSTQANDGLGPLYDATSCVSCHTDRPAAELDETSTPPGLVIRLGNARGTGDPTYGHQLQARAVAGVTAEANPDIRWKAKDGLRTATITPYRLGYGPIANDTKIGLRRAPSIKGAGLLAQIPEPEILKRADPTDADGDGIAGRAAFLTVKGTRVLGRFGWRASEPDLASQTAIAFARDIGMSTRPHPAVSGDCTKEQPSCLAAPQGAEPGAPELADAMLDLVVHYVASLPSPPPSSKPGLGERLFAEAGCAACHATLRLADGTAVPAYTDLLLHDLGPGLDDGIKEGAAEPGFWRTAPLWDVASSLKIGGLLHDGRARNVAEAIEWHAGEAARARARFRTLSAGDKAALVAFVSGL